YKYDVVLLDYPDLLANPNETGNEAQDGGRLYEDLRKMAQMNDILLWTASQLNRTSYGQEIKKAEGAIEGSHRKMNTCEFVCTLNRTEAEYEQGYMRFFIDKNRNKDNFTGDTIFLKYIVATTELKDENEVEHRHHLDLLDIGS